MYLHINMDILNTFSTTTRTTSLVEDEDFDLSKTKKKKKVSKKTLKSSSAAAGDDSGEAGASSDALMDDGVGDLLNDLEFGMGEKKKKSSKKKKELRDGMIGGDGSSGDLSAHENNNVNNGISNSQVNSSSSMYGAHTGQPWDGRDYKYDELLGRVFRILHEHNPELGGQATKTILKPPQVLREGTKKTVFANFADLCTLYVTP